MITHYESYIKHSSSKYQFLITKLCGYEFLIIIHKHSTITELYKHIEYEVGHQNFTLYVNTDPINKTNYKLIDLIEHLQRNRIISPIYKLPNPVVYRLIIDDGHKHKH
jgi:hypothetical protein